MAMLDALKKLEVRLLIEAAVISTVLLFILT
jgi:hypothetical protein